MSWPCRIVLLRFPTSSLYVTSLVKYDCYGFELCVLVNMMAELRFYLKCVDFRSGLALRVTRAQTKKQLAGFTNRDIVDRISDVDQSDTAPQSPGVHPHSRVLPCRGDSSLDLDEDEASVLLEESVVLGPGSATSCCSEGGGYEADSSDSDARPPSSPQQWYEADSSDSDARPASSPQRPVSLPRRIARRRVQPAWMRTGEWEVHWGCVWMTIWYVLLI